MFVFACLFQDIDKCIAILTELGQLAVSPVMLKKNPDVVSTIKKVGREFYHNRRGMI